MRVEITEMAPIFETDSPAGSLALLLELSVCKAKSLRANAGQPERVREIDHVLETLRTTSALVSWYGLVSEEVRNEGSG